MASSFDGSIRTGPLADGLIRFTSVDTRYPAITILSNGRTG